MRIHRIFICAAGIIAFVNLFACSTTTNKVTPLSEMPDKSNPGAIYILPKTAVALKIPIKITTYGTPQTDVTQQFITDFKTENENVKSALNAIKTRGTAYNAAREQYNLAEREVIKLTIEAEKFPNNEDIKNKLTEEINNRNKFKKLHDNAKEDLKKAKNEYDSKISELNKKFRNYAIHGASVGTKPSASGKILATILRNTMNSMQITPNEIQVVKEAVPDTKHIYNIDLNTSFLKDTKKKLVFNESGMLVSADYSAKDKTLEFSVQVVESIAKIASILIPGGGLNSMDLQSLPIEQVSPQENSEIKKYNDLITRKDKWLFGENTAGIDPSLDVFKARLAAIDARIEEAKDNILGKEVTNLTLICPIDDSLLLHDGQHKLLPLFTDDIAQQRLAQLRATVFEKAGAAGIAKLESLEIRVKVNDEHPSQKIKGLVAEQKGERGLYYRMPGEVSITLVQTKDGKLDKVLGDTFKVAVAQLGPVLSLPSKMKTTDAAFSMEFFTDTGSLKSLGVETKAIDMQQVEKLGNSGVALVSAIAASNNKINQLKQQKEELSLEMDIRELREGKRPTQ